MKYNKILIYSESFLGKEDFALFPFWDYLSMMSVFFVFLGTP